MLSPPQQNHYFTDQEHISLLIQTFSMRLKWLRADTYLAHHIGQHSIACPRLASDSVLSCPVLFIMTTIQDHCTKMSDINSLVATDRQCNSCRGAPGGLVANSSALVSRDVEMPRGYRGKILDRRIMGVVYRVECLSTIYLPIHMP